MSNKTTLEMTSPAIPLAVRRDVIPLPKAVNSRAKKRRKQRRAPKLSLRGRIMDMRPPILPNARISRSPPIGKMRPANASLRLTFPRDAVSTNDAVFPDRLARSRGRRSRRHRRIARTKAASEATELVHNSTPYANQCGMKIKAQFTTTIRATYPMMALVQRINAVRSPVVRAGVGSAATPPAMGTSDRSNTAARRDAITRTTRMVADSDAAAAAKCTSSVSIDMPRAKNDVATGDR